MAWPFWIPLITKLSLKSISKRTAAEYVLHNYSQPVRFTCEDHVEWGMYYSIKIIINSIALLFDNSKQKISADSVRKDVVSGFKTCHREV